jgi:hypothetical protein
MTATGVGVEEIGRIRAKGWNSFGRFALACGNTPGGQRVQALLRSAAVVTGSGGDGPDEARVPIVRRLYFGLTHGGAEPQVEASEQRRRQAEEACQRSEISTIRHAKVEVPWPGVGRRVGAKPLFDRPYWSNGEDSFLRYVRWKQASKRNQEPHRQKVDSMEA